MNNNTPKLFSKYISDTEKCEIVTLTKDLVDWMLSINTHNRSIRPAIVKRYADEIRRGEWFVTSQGLGISSSGILLDGQHRLLAIKQLGYPPVRMLVCYGLDERGQVKVDTHGKRTAQDLLSLAVDIKSDKTLPSALRMLFALERRITPNATSNITMSDIVEKYEEYDKDWQVLPVRNKKGVGGGFAACVMFAHHIGAPTERLVRFLTVFDTRENSDRTDPPFYLRECYEAESDRSLGFQTKPAWIAKIAFLLTMDLKGERRKKYRDFPDYADAIEGLATVAKSFK